MIDIQAFERICPGVTTELVAHIDYAATMAGVKPEILAAVIAVESGCRPNVKSPAGAVGYTQVMPSVWKPLARDLDLDIYHPPDNILLGAKILSIYNQNRTIGSALKRYHGYTDSQESKALASAYANKVLSRANKITSRTWDKEDKKCICTPEICLTPSTGIQITSVLLPLIMLFIMVAWLWAADMRVLPLWSGLKHLECWETKYLI
jgi:hypothetical protein